MTLTYSVETSVGQIVAERPSRARVFERYGIDYCCGGKLPLKTLAVKKGLDPAVVLDALVAFDTAPAPVEADWRAEPIPALVDHLVATHHAYLKEAMPRLSYLADKVARVHGDVHPELITLAQVYHAFEEEMSDHLEKEEQVLFPLIKRLVEAPAAPEAGFVANPIAVMEHEHDSAGRALEQMRELSGDYAPPEDACNSYRALFAGLEELELDTFTHIHKENNILHPRVLKLVGRA